MLLLGHAWQRGLVPVSYPALRRAIELNGATVEANLRAFAWGRRVAADPESVRRLAGSLDDASTPEPELAALIDERARFLAAYQNEALARRFREGLAPLVALGDAALARAAAVQYARLLAVKDEYEVARLYAETDFLARLDANFEGPYRLSFHFAPPFLARLGPDGRPRKLRFGPWMLPLLRGLARLRGLRGTFFDLFGRSAERRRERQLIADYEADLDLLATSAEADAATRFELANWPASVRGFGPVKEATLAPAAARRAAARARLGS